MNGNTPLAPARGVEQLGSYIITGSLGEGTFGKVKLAVHALSGQHVALKFIHKGRINRMKVRTRIVREIEYLKMLKHPHIIKLYEVINTPTEVIMVMEYAGGELFNYIVANGRLPEAEARRFLQQMLYALAYSHSHNIVHRDIKPENVLLDDALNVKLADFGLSNEIRDGSWLSTSCGSPNYAAPEVISGSLYAGPEIDVWSLGVILYVMLCGRLPFEDEHVPALFQKIASGKFHSPQYLSEDARYLISGMLVVDPMKRLTVQEILVHRWTNVDLPPYLQRMKSELNPGRRPNTLTSLLDAGANSSDPDFIEDVGKLDRVVFDQLVSSLGVPARTVRAALDASGENAVKVAYRIFQDKALGGNPDALAPKEPEPYVASTSTSGAQPMWIPQSGPKLGPYLDDPSHSEDLFTEGEGYTEDDDEYDDFESGSLETEVDPTGKHNFNWLDTSLVDGGANSSPSPVFQPVSHHLASYANSRAYSSSRGRISPGGGSGNGTRSPRSRRHHRDRERDHYPRQPRWHFGIRSSSPPMEVILELYRTLQTLGIQWRSKMGIWASTQDESDAAAAESEEQQQRREEAPHHEGSRSGGDSYEGEPRENLDIYYVECRWPMRNVVLFFDLQLYQVDAMNYLVDFRDLGYCAATDSLDNRDKKLGDHPHPLLFLDCACRLIIELAGGSG